MKFSFLILIFTVLCPLGAAGAEVTYEVFSMPMNEAAKLRRERLGGEESYRRILAKLEKKEVRQEGWMTVKMVEGKRVILEEVDEFIFPTEYDRARVIFGTSGPIMGVKQPLFPIPDTAWAYDTKNMGNTLELELQKKGGSFFLRLGATKVSLIGVDEFGEKTGKVEMPRFAIQALKTGVRVVSGKAALVGTVSPPRDLQKGEEKRVWLAFVTVTEAND